eukprot:gene11179-7953_t
MSPTRPTTDDERLKVATACDTIHHVKQRFESSYTLAIAPHYRTYVLDLLAFTHVQRQQTHFQYDAIYALGLCTQFYSAMRHYAVPQEIDSIFNAMVIALQLDPQQVRRDAKRLIGLAKGRPTPLIDNLPPAELFTVVDTNPGNKEFPLTDAWAVGLGRLIELYGAVPSETIFRRWNRRGVNNARLMAAWSEFQADSQRLFNLECIQQQLLQSPATYWPPHRRVAPGALFQQERREALQQLNANLSNLSSVAKRDINLRIIFGSQTGTAEAFANELEFDAQEVNINAEVIDALNFRATQLMPKDGKEYVNAFVVAVYGEGEPTDNAKKFFKSLEELPPSTRLDHVKYTVFGLGNSQCFHDRFNVIGKRLDKDLEAMGAQRVHPLGLGDATPTLEGPESMGERFTTWKQGLLARIQAMADEPVDIAPPSSATTASSTVPSSASNAIDGSTSTTSAAAVVQQGSVPISLSARQRAMVPANYKILHSTVSHVTQLFAKTDEMTAAVEVEFDLNRTKVLYENYAGQTCASSTMVKDAVSSSTVAAFTEGLQPGDHVGVFAPNAPYVVDRFALAAGLTAVDLDRPMSDFVSSTTTMAQEETPAGTKGNNTSTTLRQVLTWQTHLSGVASLTSIKLLQRWMKDEPRLVLTAKVFAQLERQYDALVKDKGLDTSVVLDMIPKLPGLVLPLSPLLKTLPTLNPRLYSITHMLLPGDVPAAQAVAAHHCPIDAQAKLAHLIHTPTAADDTTKVTLLCRLLRYRQTKSSANRVVDGVCSSFLNERLVPNASEVALFFRQSNFHLPAPVPLTPVNAATTAAAPPAAVIMIAGGSGLAPFMSFLEARQRWLERQDVAIGPALLYFGCRTNDEYIFRDKLVSYLDAAAAAAAAAPVAAAGAHPHGTQPTLDRLMVSFSMHAHDGLIAPQTEEALHPNEILYPHEEHIPAVFLRDKDAYLQHLRTGGHVYVCGGAGQFGKAVREAVNTVAMEAFGMTAATTDGEVHPGIRRLIEEKRYFEDLAD